MLRRFLYAQENPDLDDADDVPLEQCPYVWGGSRISVYHSASAAFFAPSLAGRPEDVGGFDDPSLDDAVPTVREGAPEIEEVVDEMDVVDFRDADVTVRGLAGAAGRVAKPMTAG